MPETVDVSFNDFALDNSMLFTPTLEWQDRLSSSYARINISELPATSASAPPLNVGGQPSLQRRRLDNDPTAASDWGRLYKLEPVSGVCDLQVTTLVKQSPHHSHMNFRIR